MNANEPPSQKRKKSAAIDWREIERRLEATRIAIEHVWAPTPEETQRILRARAQMLAREPLPTEASGDNIEVVEFVLAHERYAIESRYVREVAALDNLTPLPCTPAFVLGIINARGEILSVIDLKKFFDLPVKELTDLDKVIVLESAKMRFGILADAIVGVHPVPLTDVQPSLPTLTGVREAYLRGITRERLVILDAEKLLTVDAIVVQEQAPG